MRWPENALVLIDGAIAAARAGEPAVVSLEGEAGYGKSALLRELTRRLDGFHVLSAAGEESAQDDRLQLLREWDAGAADAPLPRHPLQAARQLAGIVDRLQLTGPVALLVDDLQWIDPDSADALAALVRRAAGDRLLVVTAFRPHRRRHPAWHRVVDAEGRVIRLDGLDITAAAELVAALAPDAPPQLAQWLCEHTAGNPLHIRALLREHSAAELAALAARGELPAPAELAARMDARVDQLDPDAARLLHALAVLGDSWSDAGTAAAVGGVRDAGAALAVLRDEGLVRTERGAAVPRVRIFHAVIRAAVYDGIPLGQRRRLHGVAAARLPAAGDRLRHRVAASAGPDAGLAADLEGHADTLHERQQYREASRFLRLAAQACADPAEAERLILDAGFEALLAHDLDETAHVTQGAEDSPHRRVVAAHRLSVTKDWVRAARLLSPLSEDDIAALSPRNGYRARVLRGWLVIATGRDPRTALPDLEAARASATPDPALQGTFTFAYGQVQQLLAGEGDLWGFESERGTDRAALSASDDGLARLSWRGAVYALTGMTREAIDDLSLVTARISDGTIGFGDGVMHSLLGFAQWTAGEWRRASISMGLPLVSPLGAPHPSALAVMPLAAVTEGKPVGPAIAASRAARLAGPLPGAVYCGDMADVAALAYAGTDAERRGWHARRVADFGDPLAHATGAVPYLWFVTTGIGAAWAGDAAAVDECASRLAERPGGTWRQPAVAWLRALAAGTRGEANAGALLAVGDLPGIASFQALLQADAASAAAAERHPAAARARARAETALRGLGASGYTARLLPPTGETPAADPLAALSDREREVVALLLEGLSYAQISRELYVTRSTVAFHLSNAYAKTGTTSRHELVQLVRAA
jgi:DNA-binding CsgD family transcriptional regulator